MHPWKLKKRVIENPHDISRGFASDSLLGHGVDLDVYRVADNSSFMRIILFILLACSVILGIRSYMLSQMFEIILHGVFFVFICALLFVYRIKRYEMAANIVLITFLLGSLVYSLFTQNFAHEGFLVFFSLPFILLHLLGSKKGLGFVVLVQIGLYYLFFFHQGKAGSIIPQGYFLNAVFINFLVISFLIFLHEKREERYAEIIRSEAYMDDLTGLPNRARLIEDLIESKQAVLFLVNIDDFKEVNDSFGYDMGDTVLLFLVENIKKVMPIKNTTLYRVGGDEFAILWNHVAADEKKELIGFVNLMRHYIYTKKFIAGRYELMLRITIGVAFGLQEGIESLFTQADMALKSAKKLNQPYKFFNKDEVKETRKQFRDNIMVAQVLAEAIEFKRVYAYYQPIFCNDTQKICKYECLVRIEDSYGKILQPFEFLGLAKKTRQSVLLTRAVLEQAFECFKNNNFSFSVNLSFQDIENDRTRSFIFKKLESALHLKGRVVFEILESEGIDNYSIVSDFITKVKALGCSIAVDDFGSGYSNFSHIQKLEVDYLKIDGSLIRDLDINPSSRVLVETIVLFAKKMGINTVAEYVHSESIYNIVSSMGIDYSQGYYIGKPEANLVEGVKVCV